MNQEESFKIPDDLKVTIAKIIALQSLTTDPGQKLTMTSSVMQWVQVGLVIKYRGVPEQYKLVFQLCRSEWHQAMIMYNQGAEFWSHSLLRCAEVAADMAAIAATEDMLDYSQLDYDFTRATFGMSAYELEDQDKHRESGKEGRETA